MNQINANLNQCGGSYAIVAGKFNHVVTDKLVAGAVETLSRHGIDNAEVDIVWVPGAFEMPFIARQLIATKKYSAIITLGAVIRGATRHFDFVAGQCANGICKLNINSDIPIVFGVLTTDTVEQALARADSKGSNKGAAAATTALEMVSLLRQITG